MNVAMVHHGKSPHPAHQGFAESIGADVIPCNPTEGTGLLSLGYELVHGARLEYDVVIAEGSRPLFTIVSQGLFQDSIIIYLCADQFFFDLNYSTNSNRVKRGIINWLNRSIVDGVIAVSDFAAEFIRTSVGSSVPVRVVHPYIQSDRFEELANVCPDLSSNTAITISSAPTGMVGAYKGVDILVESWKFVRRDTPDATLRIIGKGHPETYQEKGGVKVEGYVDSIMEVFRNASLYVQPSRADTYPVTVLEALRAGLPSIVTNTTGNRSEVKTIDPMLVANPTAESLSDKMKYYFGTTIGYKEKLSRIAHQRGSQYPPHIWKSAFREEFYSLLEEIKA